MKSGPRGRFRALPLWSRWLITVVGYAVVIAVIVLVVRSGGGGNGVTTPSEAKAEAEANREAQIVIEEDQFPHVATLTGRVPVSAALRQAITGDVDNRIATSQLTGPLQSVRCATSGAASAGRIPFRCTVTSAGIAYPFLAVAEEHTRRLTWCKVDPPPIATGSAAIPLSPRCRA